MTESETIDITDIVSRLTIRANKLSYLLGMASGGLMELVTSNSLAEQQKAPIKELLQLLSDGIYDAVYKKEDYDKKETT